MKLPVLLFLLAGVFLLTNCRENSKENQANNSDLNLNSKEVEKLDSLEILAEPILSGLNVPWEIAWGPDNWIWYAEQDGLISKVNPETGETKIILEIPDVYRLRLGLLSMAIHPDIIQFPYVFVNYTYLEGEEIISKLVRYTYNGETLHEPRILLEWPGLSGHNGSRIVVSPDGKIMVITGDAFIPRKGQDANLLNGSQKTHSLNGKVLRLNIDGSIPGDNPVPGSPVWARGFRVPQGMVYSSIGNLYSAEHGHSTDDEVNLIKKGGNYGWPNVAGFCDLPKEMDFCTTHNVVQPLQSWTPTIAPSGMDYYHTGNIPEWSNSLLLVTLKTQSLRVLKLNHSGTAILSEKVYFDEEFGRLRDLCVSPEGEVYMSTSNRDWNPVDGFPEENDDRIIRISTSRGSILSKGKVLEGENSYMGSTNTDETGLNSSGAVIYEDYCASCHKSDGKGLPDLAPSLVDSRQVLGENEPLIELVMTGKQGPIGVSDVKYDQGMPAFSFLGDMEIAAVLSFIRTEFGPNTNIISTAEVAKERAKSYTK